MFTLNHIHQQMQTIGKRNVHKFQITQYFFVKAPSSDSLKKNEYKHQYNNVGSAMPGIKLLTYLVTFLLTYLTTHLLNYLLTYLVT